MRYSKIAVATAGLLLMALTGCATPEGPEITLSPHTNALFQQYMSMMHDIEHGAFAVSPDGQHGFFTYCYQGNCERAALNYEALNGCKKLAHTDCLVLAHNQAVFRKYAVGGEENASTSEEGSFYSGEEIARIVSGNTLSGQYPDGEPWSVYFATDHQLRSRGDGPSHAGTWLIVGDQLCFDYPGTANDWCARFKRNGDLIDIYRNGIFLRHMPKPKIEDGNPLGL
jgi:hypothetical protein